MHNDIRFILAQVAEVQLSYKSKVSAKDRPMVRNSQDTYDILMQIWDQDTLELAESFKVLFLNRANRVMGVYSLSHGGMTGTVADPKLVFIAALKAAACNIILAHNHPSGNLTPSSADISLTEKMVQAGKFLDINVLDHLIVTADGYLSFADDGLM
jgi:DNA repair protein RadC